MGFQRTDAPREALGHERSSRRSQASKPPTDRSRPTNYHALRCPLNSRRTRRERGLHSSNLHSPRSSHHSTSRHHGLKPPSIPRNLRTPTPLLHTQYIPVQGSPPLLRHNVYVQHLQPTSKPFLRLRHLNTDQKTCSPTPPSQPLKTNYRA